MSEVEIDDTLRRVVNIFYQFGVWRKDGDRYSWTRIFHLLQYSAFCICVFYCAYLSDDLNQTIFLVEIGIALGVVIVKLWYLIFRKDEILQFLYDPNVMHSITDNNKLKEVNNKNKYMIRFIQVYTLSIINGTIVMVGLALPLFTNEKRLPLFIRFDLEGDYAMILYWLAFIGVSTCLVIGAVYPWSMVFIWYILFNYSIEYNLLGYRFKNLGHTTTKTSRKKPSSDSFHQELIRLIKAQTNLHQTIDRFRTCFFALFIVQIVTGAISICASTFTVVNSSPGQLLQTGIYAVMLFYSFFDIFLITYLGNEITLESDRLSYSVFESNWTGQSEVTKKCMIILCEMIQQPQVLMIFIYSMDLECFTTIANGAYRMFNILQNFNE